MLNVKILCSQKLFMHWSKLTAPLSQCSLTDGVLYCHVTIDENNVTQLLIPTSLVETVLMLIYDMPQAGHPGRDRTLSAARRKFYCPTMRIDAEKHAIQCLSCEQTKGKTSTAPILEYPLPKVSFDTVGIDFWQLPRSHQESPCVLVCVDHFTCFVVLAPLPNRCTCSCFEINLSSYDTACDYIS